MRSPLDAVLLMGEAVVAPCREFAFGAKRSSRKGAERDPARVGHAIDAT
jgi:hypothetical protein